MKTFKIITLSFICLALGVSSAWAQSQSKGTVMPTLYLKAIKANVQTEANGDEVYLAITEFRHDDKNHHYTIPQFPLHWPADALSQIADLEIWKTALASGGSTEVTIGFVEHDAPPWNTDDMIGGIKIKMINQNGQLKTQWILMGKDAKEQKVDVKQKVMHSYQLTGEGGDYQVDFVLKKQ